MRAGARSSRRIALCAALSLAIYTYGAGLAAFADLSPMEILQRAVTAPERVNFRGQQATTIYYTPEPCYLVANVVHKKPFTTRVELILPAEAAGRTMLFTESQLTQYEPAKRQLIVTAIPGREIQRSEVGDLGLLSRNYEIRLVGKDSFLGRRTYNISLDPRYAGSPARKLAIDTQTFVTLKNEEYSTGPEQALRVATYFASISFPASISDSDLSMDAPRDAKVVRLTLPKRCSSVRLVRLDFKPVVPVVIPRGYVFQDAGLSVGKEQTLHLRFTNGDTAISLFEAPKGSQAAVAASEGARRTMGNNVLSWSEGDLSFVLMGKVDAGVLKDFKRWISPSKEREAVAKFSLAFKIDEDELQRYLGSGVELFDAAQIVAGARAARISPAILFQKRLEGQSTDEMWSGLRLEQQTMKLAKRRAQEAQDEADRILRSIFGQTPAPR